MTSTNALSTYTVSELVAAINAITSKEADYCRCDCEWSPEDEKLSKLETELKLREDSASG